ncbi:MAG: FHA domain-containing protein [bacterium]
MSDRSRPGKNGPPAGAPPASGGQPGFDVGGIDAAIGDLVGEVPRGPVQAVELPPSAPPSDRLAAMDRYSDGFAPTDEQLSLAPTEIEPPEEAAAADLVARLPPGPPRPAVARPVAAARLVPQPAWPAAAAPAPPSTLAGAPAPPAAARPIQNIETAYVRNPMLDPRPAVTAPQWGGAQPEAEHAHPTTLGMPEISAPMRGRLVVQGGEWDGTTWYLNRAETRLGRGEENDIVILDIGVSRRHLVIVRHPHGFRLIDLQSGNGTYVNTRRVAEVELFDGDRVELGHTCLVYDTVGEARRRRPLGMTDTGHPAVGARRVPTTWLVAMALTTFLTVLGTMYLVRTLRTPSPTPVAETNLLDTARAAITAREWERARTTLERARAEEAGPAEVIDELAARVDREAGAAAALERAQAALAGGADPATLAPMVEAIPADSAYAGDARDLLRKAELQAIERRVDEAEKLFAEGKTELARLRVRAVLQEQPSHIRARDLRRRIEALE